MPDTGPKTTHGCFLIFHNNPKKWIRALPHFSYAQTVNDEVAS